MGQFGGKRICGQTTGYNFVNSQRVDANGQCPTGWSPCNPNAKLDNIVCMPADDKSSSSFESRCPINEIEIRRKQDVQFWR